MKRTLIQSSWLVCLCSVLLLGACKKDEAPKELTPDEKAQVQAKLVAADKADGTEDKIVGKCAACALRMDGKDAHAFKYEGYTMRFCAERCLDICKKDPAALIMKN